MRKLFVSLFCLITLQACAQEIIEPPKWEEFCPAKYCNATKGPVRDLSRFKADPTGHLEDTERNYWADRRKVFETKLGVCGNYQNALKACYDAVRIDEVNSTAQWTMWFAQYSSMKQSEAIQRKAYRAQRLNAIGASMSNRTAPTYTKPPAPSMNIRNTFCSSPSSSSINCTSF